MPDFSKCVGGECPKKEKCFRFTCESKSERQAYFSLPPFSQESGVCAYFWGNDKEELPTTSSLTHSQDREIKELLKKKVNK